jgi:hypothetical protein
MDCFRKLSLLIASLVMAGVFTVACDSGTQEPEAPDTSTPLESGEATTPAEKSEDAAASIPEEFPNEIPIYPGSVPAQGRGAVSDGVPMAAVQLQSSDTPEEVYDIYKEKLSRKGWTIEKRADHEGKNVVSATNGECTATVLAAPSEDEDGSTSIFIFTEC